MPNFRHRLTRAQQRTYDRSNANPSIRLHATPRLHAAVRALPQALASAERARVERVAQAIADEIATALRVSRVRVSVNGTRPSNARGELHGLYTPSARPTAGGVAATLKVWMVTAKRGQVVAFKTFLRTLLHEICHHLDYALLGLSDSFHTTGFYQRESSLFHQIGGPAAATAATGTSQPPTRAQPPSPASELLSSAAAPRWVR
jgi:hypothetical protein